MAKKKEHNIQTLTIQRNSIVDAGEGVITFRNGLTITDGGEQWNGLRYDISSLDLTKYKHKLTANHGENIQEVIGEVFGLRKVGNSAKVDGIRFAIKENALAQFAYDMILGGFLTDFSTETIGPMPDDEGVLQNHALAGLSLVVVGNNLNSEIKYDELLINSLKKSQENGLPTNEVEELINNKDNKMAEEVKEVATEAAAEEVKEETTQVETPVEETKEEVVETPAEAPAEAPAENSAENMLKNALAPLQAEIASLKKAQFDNAAVEPEFTTSSVNVASVSNKIEGMSALDRHKSQIINAWDATKKHSMDAQKRLNEVNGYHLDKLKELGRVDNTMTIADFGNLVISPELLTEIEGYRSDYSDILAKLNFQETSSIETKFLVRSGDISMENVEMCDDGADGNLKPESEYDTTDRTFSLEELAAVTVVCKAATRFLAADALSDIAAGYRVDYDRKLVQLAIARMQQAIDSTGNTVEYAVDSDVNSLKSWVSAWSSMQEEIMNGTFILSQKSKGELIKAVIGAGTNGPLSASLMTGDLSPILGDQYIIVPNEVLPTLALGDTKTFNVLAEDASAVEAVSITTPVIYTDINQFTGRVSGALQYDLSTDAAYEVTTESGTVTRSAYQRNEMILRGSMYRGGAIKNVNRVVGLSNYGV